MSHPLLGEIEQYIERHGLSPTRFGRLAVKDPRFVEDLRSGRLPRRGTLERVSAFMHGNDCQSAVHQSRNQEIAAYS